MQHSVKPNVMDVVQSTLRQIEQSEEIPPEDTAFRNFKLSLARRIAEVELDRFYDRRDPRTSESS